MRVTKAILLAQVCDFVAFARVTHVAACTKNKTVTVINSLLPDTVLFCCGPDATCISKTVLPKHELTLP